MECMKQVEMTMALSTKELAYILGEMPADATVRIVLSGDAAWVAEAFATDPANIPEPHPATNGRRSSKRPRPTVASA
jgi:hypothetical protein